ncbi:hypothetical protein [Anoxybacteroides amylolyticum]|uniref:Putative membrane protein n=1 Tax=Anoxybacteroides amylolyticum TaxID=294699 RepID=A0A167TU59_9BACL|nr:hypothetical protein [Anoxybacillus amylolyticus]ANB62360.1 putative membrane protein [Anoxybacillus amylolyticus]
MKSIDSNIDKNIVILLISFCFLSVGDRIFQFYCIFFIFEYYPELIVLMTATLLIGNIIAFPLFKIIKTLTGDHNLFITALIIKCICYLTVPYFFENHFYFSFFLLAIESFMDIVTLPYIYGYIEKKIASSFYGVAAKIDLIDRLTLVSSPWITTAIIKYTPQSFIGVITSVCVLVSIFYFIKQKTENIQSVSEIKGLKSIWKNNLKLSKEIKLLLLVGIVTTFVTSPLLDVILPAVALIDIKSDNSLLMFASLEFILSTTFILANLTLVKIKPKEKYLISSILFMGTAYFLLALENFIIRVSSLVLLGFFFTMYKLNILNLYKNYTNKESFAEILLLRNSLLFIVASLSKLIVSTIISLTKKLEYLLIFNGFVLVFLTIYIYIYKPVVLVKR